MAVLFVGFFRSFSLRPRAELRDALGEIKHPWSNFGLLLGGICLSSFAWMAYTDLRSDIVAALCLFAFVPAVTANAFAFSSFWISRWPARFLALLGVLGVVPAYRQR
jgi:hypothetical protein